MDKLVGQCEGFNWDKGNSEKNWVKHHVSTKECEEVFFNKPYVSGVDKRHSKSEKRWYVLGQTDLNRTLFIVFTIRKKLIRVISARDMNKKERRIYYEQVKKHSKI